MHIHMQYTPNPQTLFNDRSCSTPPASPFPSIYWPQKPKQKDKICTLAFYLWVPPSYIPKQLLKGMKKTKKQKKQQHRFRDFSSIHLNLIKVRGKTLIAESNLVLFFQPLIPNNIAWHHRPCCAQAWVARIHIQSLTNWAEYSELNTHAHQLYTLRPATSHPDWLFVLSFNGTFQRGRAVRAFTRWLLA